MDPDYGKKDEGPGRTLKTVSLSHLYGASAVLFFILTRRILSFILYLVESSTIKEEP